MKNSIRYWIIALTLPALLLSSDFAYADAGDFELSVRNQVQTAANRLEFDVYLLDTDPLNDFYLSTEQFGILFNSMIYQGGTVSVAIDNTGSGLGVNQIIYQTPVLETDAGYPNQTLIKLAGEISRIPLAQCTLISKVSPGTLVTHFILTSTVSFAAGSTPDLTFTSSTDVTPLYATRIVTSDGSSVSELPTTSGGNAVIYGNPSLNTLPAAAGAITGTATVCQGQSGVAYSVPEITNATGYSWSYSGNGATITGTTNSITISFAGDATSGNLTVYGVNIYGNGAVSANYPITVNPLPSAAGTITGTSAVCQGAASVPYSVAAITNATSYTWSYSGTGVTITGTTNSVTISFAANATSGNLSVYGVNTCGNGTVSANYPITVNPLPAAAGTITGTAAVCQGQSAVSYSVPAIANATSYTWAYSGTGATISGSTNPMTINFASNATSGNLTVRGVNSCGNGTGSANYPITVNALPVTSDITGNATPVCSSTGNVYSVTATAGSSYAWTVPAGSIITAGGGTNSITVTFGTTNGNVAVTETNAGGCVGTARTLAITLQGCGLDANFTGTPLTVCVGSAVTFTNTSAGTTGSTSYSWNFGSGATPATANTIGPHSVTYSTSGLKTVSLIVTEGASNTETKVDYITVNPLPAAAGTITGTAAVCQGQSAVSYSVPAITSATSYLWAYSGTGATITGTSNSVTVSFAASATSGNLTVGGVNTCGNGTVSAGYPVTVNALPATSDITGNATPACSSTGNVYSVTPASGSTYLWTVPTGSIITAGSGTNSITVSFGTNSGNITVTETNSTGCIGSAKTLAISLAGCGLDANFTATPLEACIGATIAFSSTSLGTTGSTTYSWNFGSGATPATANTIGPHGVTYSTSGLKTVSLTVTDGASNTETKTDYITIDPLPSAAGTISGNATVCQGQGGVAYSVPAITNATSYQWAYSGTGATITGTSNSVTVSFAANATSGNLTVRGVNICGNGAVSPAFAIAMNLLPAAAGTITGPASVCQGQSAVSYSVGAIANATSYTWAYSGTGATITGTTNSVTVSFASNATSGNLTVRGVNSCGNGTSSANYLVTVNSLPAQPTITAGSATTFCAGGSVSLTSSVGTTYLWSTGAVTQSIDVTTPGSYTVQVTNAAGCQSIASAATNVTINALPVVNAGTDKSIPNGTSTTLDATVTGTGPFTYSWVPANMLVNATVVDPATVNLPATTTFTLTVTSTATTCSNSDAVTVTVTGGELSSNPTATPSTVCAGSSVQLSAAASGGSGTYTYSWTSVPAGFTSIVANPTATPAVNTVYHVAVNDGYNTVNAQVSVTVNALPAQPVITPGGPTSFCAGSGVTLASSTGTTYLWSNGATSQSINVIASGTFTVRITNAAGCQSISSEAVTTTVNALPSAPIVGEITPPTCSVATGSVVMMGLPSTGNWILTRYPGTFTLDGSGASYTVDGLSSGLYNYTVTNASGCTSSLSANVNIPAQPATPATPLVGTITQPTYTVPTGSVNLSGLPVSGLWTITINPGSATITGSGATRIVTGLDPGTYTFTVTNAAECTSLPTVEVTINARPGVPILVINNPATICSNQTTDLTLPAVTAGSDDNLTYTYWTDAAATVAYATPTAATEGTYYIRGTSTAGYYNTKPVVVTADQLPVADAGPDQVLEYIFGTDLNADIPEIGVGAWSLVSGQGEIFNSTAPFTAVNGLGLGDNVFKWAVTNGVCPEVSDIVTIKVNDLIIPTLITPNGDAFNQYFVLRGLESMGTTELIIFDRRGMKVYENKEYDNTWEGQDYNSNPLPDDTYFYTIRSANGKSLSGYIVVRR